MRCVERPRPFSVELCRRPSASPGCGARQPQANLLAEQTMREPGRPMSRPGTRAPTGRRSALDDSALHRPQYAEQFALLLLRHLELVEGGDQILDQRVEVAFLHAHSLMRRLHVLAGVGAGTTGALADQVD